jgi:hypothetical protein
MIDRNLFSLVPGNITGLFRSLNGAPMYDILDTLEAVTKEKSFYPNPDLHRPALQAAGIFVRRMEAAMAAVLHKTAHQITWQKYTSVYAGHLSMLPDDQRKNILDFWTRGPSPGLQDGAAALNPTISTLSWDRYVDMFTECIYDVNYNVTNYFSSTLQVKYSDGTQLELDIEKDFSQQELSSAQARDAMARGSLGRGGRIFPTQMTEGTVPRLWSIRNEAFVIQNEALKDFANLAIAGISFVLSVPAMPAGMAPATGSGKPRVTRRQTPGTPRKPGGPGGPPPSGTGTPPSGRGTGRTLVVGRGRSSPRTTVPDRGTPETMDFQKSTNPDHRMRLENAIAENPTLKGQFDDIFVERMGVSSTAPPPGISGTGLNPSGVGAARELLRPGGTIRILQHPTTGQTMTTLETGTRNMLSSGGFGNITVAQHSENGVLHLLVTATKM